MDAAVVAVEDAEVVAGDVEVDLPDLPLGQGDAGPSGDL